MHTTLTFVRQDQFAGQSQGRDGVLTDESRQTSWMVKEKRCKRKNK